MKVNLSVHYSQKRVVTKRNDEAPQAFNTVAQALNNIDDMRENAEVMEDATITMSPEIWDLMFLSFLAHNKNQ